MNGLPTLAQDLASRGRNGDTMLVHMTPGEVGGLQSLAQQFGGSLTVNPDTGLPEANILKNLLPMIAGIGLSMIPGVGPLAAGMITGGFETVRTGDLGRGVLAGLGAAGGANLASGLSQAGAAAAVPDTVASTLNNLPTAGVPGVDSAIMGNTANAGASILNPAAQTTLASATPTVVPSAAPSALTGADIMSAQQPGNLSSFLQSQAGGAPVGSSAYNLAGEQYATALSGAQQAATGAPNTLQSMGSGVPSVMSTNPAVGPAARDAFMTEVGGTKGLMYSTVGAAAPVLFAQPEMAPFPNSQEESSNYEGPYTPSERRVRYPDEEERRRIGTSEYAYFSPSNPIPFAEGGEVATGGIPITPAEARVYRNIANVQQLAGLPSIAGVPAELIPMQGQDKTGMVYQPINRQGGPMAGSGEVNYEIAPLGKPAGPGGMVFYELTPAAKKAASPGMTKAFIAGLTNRDSAKYQQSTNIDDYEMITPTGRVDMSQYYYDPEFGGYVKKYSPSPLGSFGFSGLSKGGAFAKGGRVSVPEMEDGGFVLTKKAIDGLGKGNNDRGQKVASQGLGAIPIRGPGTGTSDSIPTKIKGKNTERPALVSNREAYIPKREVERRGGAAKLQALMKAAERKA